MTAHSASDTDRYAAVRLALGEPSNLDTDEEILTRCILADLDTANRRADTAEQRYNDLVCIAPPDPEIDPDICICSRSKALDTANATIEAIREAMGGYPDSDLVSLATTLKARDTACDTANARADEAEAERIEYVRLYERAEERIRVADAMCEWLAQMCEALNERLNDASRNPQPTWDDAAFFLAAAREAVQHE